MARQVECSFRRQGGEAASAQGDLPLPGEIFTVSLVRGVACKGGKGVEAASNSADGKNSGACGGPSVLGRDDDSMAPTAGAGVAGAGNKVGIVQFI
jgi:hypothetical protein